MNNTELFIAHIANEDCVVRNTQGILLYCPWGVKGHAHRKTRVPVDHLLGESSFVFEGLLRINTEDPTSSIARITLHYSCVTRST